MRLLLIAGVLCLGASSASAILLNIDLIGSDTTGLSGANHGLPSAATGGELGEGLLFETDTNMLSFEFGYGSGADASFVDLVADYTNSHIHIIAGPNADPLSPTATGGVAVPLGDYLTQIGTVSGTYTGSVALSGDQVTALFENRLYINVHSVTYPGGEIRGNLVAVPEPAASATLLGLAAMCVVIGRVKRARNVCGR